VSDAEGEMRDRQSHRRAIAGRFWLRRVSLHGRWACSPIASPIRNELEYWLQYSISPETLFYDDEATQDARLKAKCPTR